MIFGRTILLTPQSVCAANEVVKQYDRPTHRWRTARFWTPPYMQPLRCRYESGHLRSGTAVRLMLREVETTMSTAINHEWGAIDGGDLVETRDTKDGLKDALRNRGMNPDEYELVKIPKPYWSMWV